MSRYVDVNGSARPYNNRGPDPHTASALASRAHRTPAYQTVEELTRQLESSTAVNAAPFAVNDNSSPQRGSMKSSATTSYLLTPPPPRPTASWNAADVIALYLRRQRLAIQRGVEDTDVDEIESEEGEERNVAPFHHSAHRNTTFSSSSSSAPLRTSTHPKERLLDSYRPKLLLLGDDAVVQQLRQTLQEAEAETTAANRAKGTSPLTTSTQQPQLQPQPEVYSIPAAVDGLSALRAELCRWCDVVLLCYDVASPATFLFLQETVIPAVLAACADNSADGEEDDDEMALYAPNPKESPRFGGRYDVWPGIAPPLVIVGMGAEARLSRPTNLQAPWITNADVLACAAEAGVHRVVELYSHSPRHLHILLQHCRSLREIGYEALDSPAAQGRRAARKEAGLHILLRAPPPVAEVHPEARTVHVALPPRIPTSSEGTSTSSVEGAETCEVQCCYAVSDAADGAAVQLTHVVPPSGVLHFADLYAAYTHLTGRPAQCAAAMELTVCTVVPYLFPSEAVRLALPIPAAPPEGYVDVAQRCCRLTLPHNTRAANMKGHVQALRGRTFMEQQQQHMNRARRVRYTLDGVTTTVDIPVEADAHGGRLRGPVTVCLPLDGSRGNSMSPSVSTAAGCLAADVAWKPWPSALPAASQARLLRVVVEEETEEATDDGEKATSNHPSHTATTSEVTFVVPPVLPSPEVVYNALDRSLRLHVPGHRADQVEIRYTLDGSAPSHTHGAVYKEAVFLEQADRVRVRAVAYPKLRFASKITDVSLNTATATTTAAPFPQLQEDEHLSPASHAPVQQQWSTPVRPQRTPKRLPPPQSFSTLSPHPHATPVGSARSTRRPRRGVSSSYARLRTSSRGSEVASTDSEAPTTRAAQLRQAFNAGMYTPPRHPFSSGEGFTPSPRSQRHDGRR